MTNKKDIQTTKKKTKSKKTLAKGLDVIFGENLEAVLKEVEDSTSKNKTNISKTTKMLLSNVGEINITKIIPNPYQPRRVFDEEKLKELSSSIKRSGLLTPIVVKETAADKFYIIAGERRYRAMKIAKFTKINAIKINVSDRKMQELALIENIQREDLNPIEEAVAVKYLIDNHKMTHEETSKILGKSRAYITNTLRLLKLEDSIKNAVLNGELTYGHVKPLISLEKEKSLLVFERIKNENLTVRDVENIVRGYKLREARTKTLINNKKIKKSSEIEYVEDLIRNKLKTRVNVTNNKIIIKYKGTDQLNRILERMDALEK